MRKQSETKYGISVSNSEDNRTKDLWNEYKKGLLSQKGRKALARRRAAKVASLWSVLARAKKSGDKDLIICAAEKCLICYSSEQRLERMIHAVGGQPPEIFWPVWLEHWSYYLPRIFNRQGSALPYMSDEAKAKFDNFQHVVTVYRGCDERFKHGVSWTTDRNVAGRFASGGRYGRPICPVIVTGRIKKHSSDFYYCDDTRDETEIVCTPAIDKVEPYTGPWPSDEVREQK